LAWFAHAARLINLIEIGRRGEIRGSVLPEVQSHNAFLFHVEACSSQIRLWSYCRAWCVQVSQHQRSAYLRILWDEGLEQKRKVWRLRTFFVAQTVPFGEQKISLKSHIFKNDFYRLLLLQTKVLPTTQAWQRY